MKLLAWLTEDVTIPRWVQYVLYLSVTATGVITVIGQMRNA